MRNPAYEGLWNHFRIDGKVAIVGGASQGIGRAAAVALAAAGADVAILGHSHSPSHTAEAVRACGRNAMLFQGDLTRPIFVLA